MDLISLSQEPPKCGALGGLKMNLIWCSAKWVCREGCMSLTASWSSRWPPLKLVPWSDSNSAGLPLREINRLKAIRNESVSRLVKTSMCTALVVKHLNTISHLFSLRRPILTKKGPKQSIPVEKNGGQCRRRRAGGRSAMRGITGWALHFWHSTQPRCSFRIASRPRSIQYLHRSTLQKVVQSQDALGCCQSAEWAS